MSIMYLNTADLSREEINKMELKEGIRNTKEAVVTEDITAAAAGSGGLPVYATPAMVVLMEMCAWESVEPCMESGYSTVGTRIDVKHLAASPVGAHIVCESALTEVDGRRLVFEISARDETGLIGTARHERFIINCERFMEKTLAKLK